MKTAKESILNTVYLGDCLDLLGKIPSNSVDLVVTSPPYNIGKEYEDVVAMEKYLDEQNAVIKECVRVLKDTGSVFWEVGSYTKDGIQIPLDVKFFPLFENLGLRPRNRIVWVRPHGLNASNKFSGRHETILWFTKGDSYKFNLNNIRVPQKYQNKKAYRGPNKGKLSSNPDGKNPGDIWAFRNVKHNHEERTIHPAQFPEDLIERIVLSVTDEGDTVLDPFMGVGTVAVVAQNYKRHYYGAELDSKYHSVAMRRLSGEPDENNCFPNLKTLRDYVERTGADISKFRFDVQVGDTPSLRGNSKIHSEEEHLYEMYSRLSFEEATFTAQLRGDTPPDDSNHVKKPKQGKDNLGLFETIT